MRHPFDSKVLSAYLDGECSADLAAKIKAHAKGCSSCFERLTAFTLTKKMLTDLEPIEVSEDFDFEFTRRLDEAIIARGKIGIVEKTAQQIFEGIKTIAAPPIPVFAKVVTLILLVLTVTLGAPYYFAKSPLGVKAVSGKVEVYSSRTQSWVETSRGARLNRDDIVRTGATGRIDIGVDKMFTVRLKGNTELKTLSMLPRFKRGAVSYEIEKGEILVNIKEDFNGSRFIVYTPQAIAKARGTSFAVNVSREKNEDKTWLAVLHGAVEVESRNPLYATEENIAFVRGGQKTEVAYDRAPTAPSLLLEREWERLIELYQIGKKPQVILLISESESRVRELLAPCAIYIYDVEPRTISERLEKAVANISRAIADEDIKTHLQAIHELELMVEEGSDRPYNPQLFLFIGTYYEYLSQHEKAISTFEDIVDRYPDSQFASLAQCAIGIIYHEKLGKKVRAREIFESLISNYPNSLEELEAKKALAELES